MSGRGASANARILHAWAPVRDGEVWGVGPHRVLCADLREVGWTGRWDLLAEGAPPVEAVWSYPPPSRASACGALRKAGRLTASVHYEDLLVRFADLVATVMPAGLVRLRFPPRLLPTWQALAEARAWEERDLRGAPAWADRSPLLEWTAAVRVPPEGQPAVVLDPCCGTGAMLAEAARAGSIALGIDLVPERVPFALRRLEVVAGVEARRLC